MKSIYKTLNAAAVVCWLLTAAQLLLWLFVKVKHSVDISNASSIGIIGGADGPTAVFVAPANGAFNGAFFAVVPCAALILTIILSVKKAVEKHR